MRKCCRIRNSMGHQARLLSSCTGWIVWWMHISLTSQTTSARPWSTHGIRFSELLNRASPQADECAPAIVPDGESTAEHIADIRLELINSEPVGLSPRLEAIETAKRRALIEVQPLQSRKVRDHQHHESSTDLEAHGLSPASREPRIAPASDLRDASHYAARKCGAGHADGGAAGAGRGGTRACKREQGAAWSSGMMHCASGGGPQLHDSSRARCEGSVGGGHRGVRWEGIAGIVEGHGVSARARREGSVSWSRVSIPPPPACLSADPCSHDGGMNWTSWAPLTSWARLTG